MINALKQSNLVYQSLVEPLFFCFVEAQDQSTHFQTGNCPRFKTRMCLHWIRQNKSYQWLEYSECSQICSQVCSILKRFAATCEIYALISPFDIFIHFSEILWSGSLFEVYICKLYWWVEEPKSDTDSGTLTKIHLGHPSGQNWV